MSAQQSTARQEITYGSVCSGIEAATMAWHPLRMRTAWFAEIEPAFRYCANLLGG